MGVSNVPFGDLSVADELSDASVAAFRCSNDIFSFFPVCGDRIAERAKPSSTLTLPLPGGTC